MIKEVKNLVDPLIKFYAFDFGIDNRTGIPIATINMDALLSTSSVKHLPNSQGCNFGDKMLYIYTAGTTGLPKAVQPTIDFFKFLLFHFSS